LTRLWPQWVVRSRRSCVKGGGVSRAEASVVPAKRATSLASTVLVLLFATLCVVAAGACAGDKPNVATTTEYKVLRVGGSSTYPNKLYTVLVPAGVTRSQLEAISRGIVDQAKQGEPVNYIWIMFYDYAELAEHAGPSLGWVRFGPSDSDDVEAGHYEAMSFSHSLPKKNWSERPSEADVALWAYWQKLFWRARASGPDSPRYELDRRTARHFDVSVARVEAAMNAVDSWVTPPIGRVW